MFKIKSATRLALTIGCACATIIWIAVGLGLISNPQQMELRQRIAITRTAALSVSSFAARKRSTTGLAEILNQVSLSDESVTSVGVRRAGRNDYLAVSGPHKSAWVADKENDNAQQISVEILSNGRPWGQLEIAFKPFQAGRGILGISFPYGLIAFVGSGLSLLSWFVLSKTFRYLNPSKVVPNRVRSALDTLAEGLVLIDKSGEIAHANNAFVSIVKSTESEVLGMKLDDFDWSKDKAIASKAMPWDQCRTEESRITGDIVQLKIRNEPTRKFVVNATPITDGGNTVRGALISFDDVTAVENKNAELAKIIGTLRHSRDEVARQNEKLNFLASYDPLTKCMNRRAFFGQFEEKWADEGCENLNLMILDVDHFKAVNDNHGHSTGDEVLKAMGDLLRNEVGNNGLVCRYGGEEFVVLMPKLTVDEFVIEANKLRKVIEQTEACGINFTASFGVSCRHFKPMDPQHMLDQADESLYIAKRHGRNQVVRYDERDQYEIVENEPETANESEIPYSAVTGLLSALSFRCSNTAQHSIRVANICVKVGGQLMSRRELYRLEIAALLHDIGKIGVPDSILHKPGKLTENEWEVMRKHDDIGVEIVRNAFASEFVTGAIESHHYCSSARMESGNANILNMSIPLAARIINVCDAYDSMTNDQIYRKAMKPEEALNEILANSPRQFDPQVVVVLASIIEQEIEHPETNSLDSHDEFGARSAAAIGQHIEELYEAIELEDVERLQSVVDQLKIDATEAKRVTDAANRLDDALKNSDEDLESVLSLANEVMKICRSTRSKFVESVGTIVGN